MLKSQEPKYDVDANGRLVNRATGIAIPDDEPVFVLRAKDKHAVKTLMRYADMCGDGDPRHIDVVHQRLTDFIRFSEEHPERMHEPDSAPL